MKIPEAQQAGWSTRLDSRRRYSAVYAPKEDDFLRRAVWIGIPLVLLALVVATFIGGGFYDMYGRWSAKNVVVRALEGFSREAVPRDVKLELGIQDPRRTAEALRAGFEVEVTDSILLSYRSFEVLVRVSDGSNLQCDLYYLPEWDLKCWPLAQRRHAA